MAKANSVWKAHDHSSIQKLSDRVWRVEGGLPGIPMRRVMTIAKLANGGLVVHNGIALRDAEIEEIDAWGPVRQIIVPNGYHRLDAMVFHRRYPGAQVLAPDGAKKRVEEVVRVDATFKTAAPDGHVELINLEGVNEKEGAMIVNDSDGTTVVLTDAVFNMPHGSGAPGFVLKNITGSSGGPKVSNLFRWFVIKDKKAFRAHIEWLADLPDLRRVIVAHHETIEIDAANTLRAAVSTL
jgi:hypothetical protein